VKWEKGKVELHEDKLILMNMTKTLIILAGDSDITYCSEIQRTDSKYCFTILLKRKPLTGELMEYVFLSIG
jgi:hypothetical protein